MSRDSVLSSGVPLPFLMEAPSGWLSRLALSQGCTIQELLRFLNLRHDLDWDLQLHSDALAELRRKCGLTELAFALAELVVDGFHFAKLPRSLLLSDSRGNARFRVCPGCLADPKTGGGVLLIYWRFADWRYCPRHRCLMEERCFACRSYIKSPVDMALTRAGVEGFASQRRCQSCAVDLATAPRVMVDLNSSRQFTERERRGLLAGRKFVATLCGEGGVDHSRLRPSIERLAEASADMPRRHRWPLVEARVRAQVRREAALAAGSVGGPNPTVRSLASETVIVDPRWPWPVRR